MILHRHASGYDPMRRAFALLLLALTLVLAQAGGAAHAIAHLGNPAPTRDGHQLPHAPHCDICNAFSAVDGAPPPPALLKLPAVPIRDASPAHVEALVAVRSALPFSSRAPPSIS